MIVPRGTPKVSRLRMRTAWRDALMAGSKTEHRVLMTEENSVVSPGSFEALDLSSGRVRPLRPRGGMKDAELRARCLFPSGARAVTVSSLMAAGDLIWVRTRGTAREDSVWTLEITSVGCSRLQDLSDADALAEGVRLLGSRFRQGGQPPRVWFARSWDDAPRRAVPWHANPWVWIYRFKAHRMQIDELLAAR